MNKKQPKNIIKYFFVPILLTLSLLYGCMPPAPVCVKDGVPYCRVDGSFTYEWYDYYERGLSCMEGGCYDDALADFDIAIKKRPDDKWMARTFGMHLKDYFPHRETGLIYYNLGEYGKALEELEKSIEYQKSSKALYYRDKVREGLMRERGEHVTIPAFVLPAEIWSKDNPVKISGTVESAQYVSEITVGTQKVFMENSDQSVFFEEFFSLNQGKHEIEIIARNLLGGTASLKIIVYVDRSGPAIALKTSDPKKGLQGCLYDESGGISLSANGEKIMVSEENEFAVPPGTDPVMLIATDKLGNQTTASVNSGSETSEKSAKNRCALFLHSGLMSEQSTTHLSQFSAQYPDIATDGIPDHSISPEIILARLSDKESVFDEILSVEGQVIGKTAVKEVLINDTPVHKKPGKLIFFNHSERLKEGENRIVIRAKDESDTETIREFTVIRQIPEIFKQQYRCTFKTNPFDIYPQEAEDKAKRTLFQYIFLDNLVGRKRFQVRIQEELEKLLNMQHLDPKRIIAGQNEINPTPYMLSGTMYDTKEGVEAVTKVVDIRTSQILDIIDGYTESKVRPGLESVAGILAEKFHRAFPLIKGIIAEKNGTLIRIKSEGDIRMGWIVVLGSDTEVIGYGCIDEKLKNHYYWIQMSDVFSDTGNMAVTQ